MTIVGIRCNSLSCRRTREFEFVSRHTLVKYVPTLDDNNNNKILLSYCVVCEGRDEMSATVTVTPVCLSA